MKNLFVLAPLIFAKRATDTDALAAALWAVALYCMASSAVYLFNDLRDVEQDRRHPEKRRRPIAAGRVSAPTARSGALVLACAAVGGAVLLGWAFAGVVASYLLLNVAYTLKLKHVAYVDVTVIALGFLLRVIGGGLAIPVAVSGWILLVTLFISIYLGLGKRLHELAAVPDGGGRRVLRFYSARTARVLFRLSGALALGAYVLYTLSDRVTENFGTTALIWTTPLVALGQLRFDAMVRSMDPRSPTDGLLSDWRFLAVGASWCLAVIFLVYL
ncbi:MAG: UbiA prenyltransferase family protein [Pseudomonadota bacterium]